MRHIRVLEALIVLALAFMQGSALLADTRILVSKSFKGGKQSTAKPNQDIARWRMTVDRVTTERSLAYVGRTGESTIEIKSREVERPTKGGSEKVTSEQLLSVYLDCDGETVCKIDELSLALRVSGNTLYYTILADWEEVYIDQKDRVKQCEYGHKWVEEEYFYCPICGLPLRTSAVKPTAPTAVNPDKN
jgi:hypothetical protein